MINTLAQIDQLATAGASPWHRASAISKLLLATAIVGIAVGSRGAALPGALFAIGAALALLARVPLRLVVAAAVTPLFFVAVFVVAHWRGDPRESLAFAMRPVAASVAALWLVTTTPYPDLFAPLSRLLPRPLGDGLFLTYRAVFALLDRVERLWRAMFLRGALGAPWRRRLTGAGEAVGTLILHGFERSQQQYQVMLLRGHSGRICGCRHYLEFAPADAWVAAAAALVLLVTVLLWGAR